MKTLSKKSLQEYKNEESKQNANATKEKEGLFWKYVFDVDGTLKKKIPSLFNTTFCVGEKSIEVSGIFEQDNNVSGIGFEGSAINRKVFEFLSNNTTVEWGLSLSPTRGQGYLYSSNLEKDLIPSFALRSGYEEFYHNHGSEIAGQGCSKKVIEAYDHPSQGDKDKYGQKIMDKYNYSGFYIYNEANEKEPYHKWDSSTDSMEKYCEENGLECKS